MISKVPYKGKGYNFAKKRLDLLEVKSRLAAASTGLDNEIDTLVAQVLQKSETL